MKTKTVVLWGREDLLSSSVELFLAAQKGWKVVNILEEENPDALVKSVNTVKPDVVIIQKRDLAGNLNLPTILLHTHPELKVVTVSQNDNLLEVFSKQNILITSASDLTSVVDANQMGLAKKQIRRGKQKGGDKKNTDPR